MTDVFEMPGWRGIKPRALGRIASPQIGFFDSAMTITEVIPYVWQGAMPHPETDFSFLGPDVRVFIMCPCEHALRGCETTYRPLRDNADEPRQNPPRIEGITAPELLLLGEEVAWRQVRGLPSVSICQWGYNRSGLIVGLGMARLRYEFDDILTVMRASRGPHPHLGKVALNNNNFRAFVERACSTSPPLSASS